MNFRIKIKRVPISIIKRSKS